MLEKLTPALLGILVLSVIATTTLVSPIPAVAQGILAPEKAITLADVQSVLGGKFEGRAVEPGIYNWEEVGGPRVVQIWLWPAEGKTVADLKATALQHGETVEDVPGVGDAAMYRPQQLGATVEKQNKAGELLWLDVRVHNVEGAAAEADAKKFAIELAKRGAARL